MAHESGADTVVDAAVQLLANGSVLSPTEAVALVEKVTLNDLITVSFFIHKSSALGFKFTAFYYALWSLKTEGDEYFFSRPQLGKKSFSSKPTFAAVGNLSHCPRLEELVGK